MTELGPLVRKQELYNESKSRGATVTKRGESPRGGR